MVSVAVTAHQVARRQGDGVKGRPPLRVRRGHPTVPCPKAEHGHPFERGPLPDGIDQCRNDLLPVVEADRVDLVDFERGRVAHRRVPADDHENPRRRPPDLERGLSNPVVLQGVRAGDADDPRPRPPHPRGRAGTKAEIRHRRIVTVGAQRRPDVLEAQRFDAKERTEPEPLVSRFRSKEKNIHIAPWTH